MITPFEGPKSSPLCIQHFGARRFVHERSQMVGESKLGAISSSIPAHAAAHSPEQCVRPWRRERSDLGAKRRLPDIKHERRSRHLAIDWRLARSAARDVTRPSNYESNPPLLINLSFRPRKKQADRAHLHVRRGKNRRPHFGDRKPVPAPSLPRTNAIT